MSWLDRLRGGFTKTAERVADNLTGLTSRAALDTVDARRHRGSADRLRPRPRGVAPHPRGDRRATFEQLDERGLRTILAEEIEKILAPVAKPLEVWGFPRPHVILVIGVNGSGKTTTIGKLGHWLKEQDYGVLLAAGDTFRAAAIEQLQIWGERIGAPVITGKEGGDAAGIVFDGVKQATATGIDVLIVDTAGRLQNKTHLMDELSKIRRVLGRLNPEAPHDVLLVLDATTGQNALAQVEVFRESAGVTGLIMTKLDGTARGGVLVAAAERFGLPIHAIGVGEQADDLRPFDPARRRPRHCRTAARMTDAKPTSRTGGSQLLIDLGPLLVFFAVNFLAPVPSALKIFVATGAFMVAMVAAMIYSALRYPPHLAAAVVLGRDGGGDGRHHHLAARRDLHQDQADDLLSARRRRCSASGC